MTVCSSSSTTAEEASVSQGKELFLVDCRKKSDKKKHPSMGQTCK